MLCSYLLPTSSSSIDSRFSRSRGTPFCLKNMGVLSRKLFPACESLCVCCPALRSSSRQPVKRYKKLLADIFPKYPDDSPNERKIVKLCEYAARNPLRIPKIVKYLEERCFKELRSEHIKFINVVIEAYTKMLCLCKEQMVYFACSLLDVVNELLDKSKQDVLLILGCQILTTFIYSQADGTYAHNIDKFVLKVCKMARDEDDGNHRCLRASSLQCLSAMVWYTGQCSYIFHAFDEIVYAILDNYEPHASIEEDTDSGEAHHNWVDEVIRSEGRGATGPNDVISGCVIVRRQPEKKDPAHLTREEIDTPKVWAQICVQRMADLAKESLTMRRILDLMLSYFDFGRHWTPCEGLAMVVLSDLAYFLEKSGHQQLVLSTVIRHLDHKNVLHDTDLKSRVIQVAASLARQIRLAAALADTGLVSDLCRHLRKSLQATADAAGPNESNLNFSLQTSIEDCLLEIAKGIADAQPLFDMIAITLEKLPSSGVVARATVRSLMVLAHMTSLSSLSPSTKQVFPDALLVQLLKAMLHSDVEVRVGAHQLLSILLVPSSNHHQHQVSYLQSRRWHSDNASAFASISALLEKLRKEKDGSTTEKQKTNDTRVKEGTEDDQKQRFAQKSSPNFYKISSIFDRTTGATSLTDSEPSFMKLSEDQIALLLSTYWIQANLPDNIPSNIEAIAHSFTLTLISSKWKNSNDSIVVQFFQLPLSLRNSALDPANGMLPPSCQRSLLLLSMGMLMFAAKIYQIPKLIDILKSLVPNDVDPYLGINEDLQVHVKPNTDIRGYSSAMDNQLASSLMSELRRKIFELDLVEMDILVQKLSTLTEMTVDDLARQLSEPFTPDEAFFLCPRTLLDSEQNNFASQSKESLSFDEDVANGSLIEDEVTSEASVADMSRFVPKMPSSPSVSHVISIGQLMESALEVAGRVAGTSVSTSPLPYDTLTRQCEALGTGTRQKLSNWLAHEDQCARVCEKTLHEILAVHPGPWKASGSTAGDRTLTPADPCLAMRLPPASPFDNFLKAAGC